MATPAGLEPATPCLEGRCSIQLSYGVVETPLKSREQIGQAQCVHVSFLLVAKLSP